MDNNPYAAPSSAVEAGTEPGLMEFHDARSVAIGRGASWISEGFGHFKQDPGPWILICIVGFVILLALNLLPIIGMFAGLLTFVWIGGLVIGCRAQDEGQPITISHLFAGFQQKFGSLLLLGVLMMLASVLIMFIAMGPIYGTMLSVSLGGDPAQMEELIAGDMVGQFLLPMLIGMLFIIPLMMFFWFAPMLIIFNDVPIFKAMMMSFKGCIKNILPLFINGLILSVLGFLMALPLLLGWLVFMPMFYGTYYRSYKDIYVN